MASRELFLYRDPQLKLSLQSNMFRPAGNDIVIPRHSFHSHICAARIKICNGKVAQRKPVIKGKTFSFEWKGYIQIPRTSIFKEWSPKKQHAHSIKAVATVEPKCWIPSENDNRGDSNWQFNPNSEDQGILPSNDDSSEMDEKERLRRMKISKANKGNVPWNKGRKHSAETVQRIRERTRIAMQDPKVKMKLVNLGHAQSEETRIKIGAGVREGWQRRREMLMVQESCLFEWQNMISEASRKGYASEDELQWDSYEILDAQLKQEWLESVEKRKTMPRPKGSKRAPKSPEQRKKISEAISAKWADPEYRGRVCSALSKYHGVHVGGEKRPRRKRPSETSSVKRESVKKKPTQPKGVNEETKSIKKVVSRRRKNSTPSYKDPMASSKLEMIKKIRADRAAMETRKREATERAKLLIAEAEKAAKALEVAALKSPLARASLLETRMLIAEATRSIESIESSQMLPQDTGDEPLGTSGASVNHVQTNVELPQSDTDSDDYTVSEEQKVNGSTIFHSDDESGDEEFDYDRLTLQNALELQKPSSTSVVPNYVREDSIKEDLQIGQSSINGSVEHESFSLEKEEEGSRTSKGGERSLTSATKTKKWVCGRLVEVEDN